MYTFLVKNVHTTLKFPVVNYNNILHEAQLGLTVLVLERSGKISNISLIIGHSWVVHVRLLDLVPSIGVLTSAWFLPLFLECSVFIWVIASSYSSMLTVSSISTVFLRFDNELSVDDVPLLRSAGMFSSSGWSLRKFLKPVLKLSFQPPCGNNKRNMQGVYYIAEYKIWIKGKRWLSH